MSEKLVIIFFWLAFALYASGFVFYVDLFLSRRQLMSYLATITTLTGFSFHTLAFIARWQSTGQIPLAGPFESYFTLAWALVLIYLLLETIVKLKVLGAWVLPFINTLMAIAWIRYESIARISDEVKNFWISFHVTVIFLAYASFTIAAGFAILYLIQQQQLKKHQVNLFFRRLPALEILDDYSNKAITFGLPFMTMTIVTGIIRAVKEFPNWYLDPVVISTTLTWFIYGSYLALRYLWGWPSRKAAYLAIVGFISIFLIRVMTYFPLFHKFNIS